VSAMRGGGRVPPRRLLDGTIHSTQKIIVVANTSTWVWVLPETR